MKENKNQSKNPTLTSFTTTTTASIGQQSVLETNFPVEDPKDPYWILDDNHKLVRRHSFDDNGGGYQGL